MKPLLHLPSPPSSDGGLPSPLSSHSDSTAPSLPEEIPSLSSSDWEQEQDSSHEENDEEEDYDMVASRDLSSKSSEASSEISETERSVLDHMRLSFPDPTQTTGGDEYAMDTEDERESEVNSDDDEDRLEDLVDSRASLANEYSMLLDAKPTATPPATTKEAPSPITVTTTSAVVVEDPSASILSAITNTTEVDDTTPVGSRLLPVTPSPSTSSHNPATISLISSVSSMSDEPLPLLIPTRTTSVHDIEAWVKLTDSASARAVSHPSPSPTPLPVSSIPGTPSSLPSTPTIPQTSATVASRFLAKNQRDRPSSAARVTAPTPKETKETANSIVDKLEDLARKNKEQEVAEGRRKKVWISAVLALALSLAVGLGVQNGLVGSSEVVGGGATINSNVGGEGSSTFTSLVAVASALMTAGNKDTDVLVVPTSSSSTSTLSSSIIATASSLVATTSTTGSASLAVVTPNCSILNPKACALSKIVEVLPIASTSALPIVVGKEEEDEEPKQEVINVFTTKERTPNKKLGKKRLRSRQRRRKAAFKPKLLLSKKGHVRQSVLFSTPLPISPPPPIPSKPDSSDEDSTSKSTVFDAWQKLSKNARTKFHQYREKNAKTVLASRREIMKLIGGWADQMDVDEEEEVQEDAAENFFDHLLHKLHRQPLFHLPLSYPNLSAYESYVPIKARPFLPTLHLTPRAHSLIHSLKSRRHHLLHQLPSKQFKSAVKVTKSELMFRAKRAVKGAGRLKRGEIGWNSTSWWIRARGCDELRERWKDECWRKKKGGRVVRGRSLYIRFQGSLNRPKVIIVFGNFPQFSVRVICLKHLLFSTPPLVIPVSLFTVLLSSLLVVVFKPFSIASPTSCYVFAICFSYAFLPPICQHVAPHFHLSVDFILCKLLVYSLWVLAKCLMMRNY